MAALLGYLLTRINISQHVSAPITYSNEQLRENLTKILFFFLVKHVPVTKELTFWISVLFYFDFGEEMLLKGLQPSGYYIYHQV